MRGRHGNRMQGKGKEHGGGCGREAGSYDDTLQGRGNGQCQRLTKRDPSAEGCMRQDGSAKQANHESAAPQENVDDVE
jgi:hypothetical protein